MHDDLELKGEGKGKKGMGSGLTRYHSANNSEVKGLKGTAPIMQDYDEDNEKKGRSRNMTRYQTNSKQQDAISGGSKSTELLVGVDKNIPQDATFKGDKGSNANIDITQKPPLMNSQESVRQLESVRGSVEFKNDDKTIMDDI